MTTNPKYKVICPYCDKHIFNVYVDMILGVTEIIAEIYFPSKKEYAKPKDYDPCICPSCKSPIDLTEAKLYRRIIYLKKKGVITLKVIKEGHEYELAPMHPELPNPLTQTIKFIEKERKDGKFVTVVNGTTNEEVLAVLIDRLGYLDNKVPCEENKLAIKALQDARDALHMRTMKRREQGKEGTDQK